MSAEMTDLDQILARSSFTGATVVEVENSASAQMVNNDFTKELYSDLVALYGDNSPISSITVRAKAHSHAGASHAPLTPDLYTVQAIFRRGMVFELVHDMVEQSTELMRLSMCCRAELSGADELTPRCTGPDCHKYDKYATQRNFVSLNSVPEEAPSVLVEWLLTTGLNVMEASVLAMEFSGIVHTVERIVGVDFDIPKDEEEN